MVRAGDLRGVGHGFLALGFGGFLHALAFGGPLPSDVEETLLLRMPTVSAEHLAFVYAGDIWIGDRDGAGVRRLTIHDGIESRPAFSPDGAWIAFTASYDGNVDVYVVPIVGGAPRRLTYHGAADLVCGWTPASSQVLFRSNRQSPTGKTNQLFTVSMGGGFPALLKLPQAFAGSFSPDERRIAYLPFAPAAYGVSAWKRYRGGRTPPVWIFDLEQHTVVEIPHANSNDTNPMWIRDTVYFLSDREHTVNIFGYHTGTGALRQLTHHRDFDVKSAAATHDVIVYEQAGRLHRFDIATESSEPLSIRLRADLPSTRPHWVSLGNSLRGWGISPTGVRALFEARGDIFVVPEKAGPVRNLTRTPGVRERDPAWSPDGKLIAYLSDAGGEYRLVLNDPTGAASPSHIDLGPPGFYSSPIWSPDSAKLVYWDHRRNLYCIDRNSKEPLLLDTDIYDAWPVGFHPAFSPDGRWIAYTRNLDNRLRALFLYDLDGRQAHQITPSDRDCSWPVFGRDGQYLYFVVTQNRLRTVTPNMSSMEQPIRRFVYVVVLSADGKSPFLPASEDEPERSGELPTVVGSEESPEKPTVRVRIDLDGIDRRFVALPIPGGVYENPQVSADGQLFYLDVAENNATARIRRFDIDRGATEEFLDDVEHYSMSNDGKRILCLRGDGSRGFVNTSAAANPTVAPLDLDEIRARVWPRAEWRQMFHEAWRIQRDFFYDSNLHGAAWIEMRRRYEPFLEHVQHRADLSYLLKEMIGELVVGHAYVMGGDLPPVERVPVGLLGADFQIVAGCYQIQRVFRGTPWDPGTRAPLAVPGLNVKAGDFLLEIAGQPLDGTSNLYNLLEHTADRTISLRVHSKPTREGSREILVRPVSSERELRQRAWAESNRQRVSEMTGGRVAYVYVPDTAEQGYEYFNDYYFSQLDKIAVIVDGRFNSGGYLPDYILDILDRPLLGYKATRSRRVYPTTAAIFGPKVMITNERAGSGGDHLPHLFRRRGLGPIVGTRTWGGFVGIGGTPRLLDGGRVTSPSAANFSPTGEWEVENVGVEPDIEVEMTPGRVLAGHDPQLEKAVEVILEGLERSPFELRTTPPPGPMRARH